MAGLGGGDAWAKDHDKILAHARDLDYDKVPGVTLPAADAPKNEWIPAMDKFNAWKANEVAKQASGQAWWQTYPTSETSESGGGESGGLLSPSSGSIARGPYPLPNEYFPLLTTEYIRPQAISGDAYMNQYFNQGAYQVPNSFGALSYQPGTEQYQDAFPLHESILEYQPNRFGVGPVQFMGTFDGPMNVVPPEELFTEEEEEEEYDWDNDPEGRKKGDGGIPESSQTTSIGIGDVNPNPSIPT